MQNCRFKDNQDYEIPGLKQRQKAASMFASKKQGIQAMDTYLVVDFLRNTLPFKELDPSILYDLAQHAKVDFYPRGTKILVQDVSRVDFIYLIQKGGVKLYFTDNSQETIVKDYRGEGSVFGALAVIQGDKSSLTVEAVEDTFCFLFPKQVFLRLVHDHPEISQYYLKAFSQNYIQKSFDELRKEKLSPKTEGSLYLFTVKVNDIIRRKPEIITPVQSVQQAAQRMSEQHIGSLLIKDEYGKISGIITDKDIRSKVVAKGLPYSTPVEKVMTSPVLTISAHKVCFDALLAMMSNRIHHLAVQDGERIIGLVTSHDILVLQGESPLYLFKEIMNQHRIERLYELSLKIPLIVRPLIEEGAKASNITRVITILDDLILHRLLTLLQERLGPPPVPFCWLLLGSDGRKEQTFRTDQDNALVYQDPRDEQEREAAEKYFQKFSQEAVDHLVKCGYPLCEHGNMASNPKWCQPLSVWKKYFSDWVHHSQLESASSYKIFFDLRPGFGDLDLGYELQKYALELARNNHNFLRNLAWDCFSLKPPLSFFKDHVVDQDGTRLDRLELKTRGLTPFWDFARTMALKHGILETNTLERMEVLNQWEQIPYNLFVRAQESYEFQMQLRLVHQFKLMEAGETLQNFVAPSGLSDLEKQTLKSVFTVISMMQSFLKENFKLSAA